MSNPSQPTPTAADDALPPVRSRWHALGHELFDEQGLSAVFTHARNLITGTMIIAAGMHAVQHPLEAHSPSTWTVHFAGYVIATVGALLLLLNLGDGLRSLARRQHPTLWRLAAGVVYVGLSVRLVQVFMLFRLPW